MVRVEGEGEVHSAQPTHEGAKKAVVVRCNGGRLQIGGGVDVCVCVCVCVCVHVCVKGEEGCVW